MDNAFEPEINSFINPIVPGGPEQNASPYTLLTQLVALPEEEIDLGSAALAIASAHYQSLDIARYQQQLDEMAEEARRRIGRARRMDVVLRTLRDYLAGELGFSGDTENYYNPANSFLHEVLDRRRGLPIALSIVYLAVAHRLGFPLVGVGMPLHFVIKSVGSGTEQFLDPFYDGELLTSEECFARLEQIAGRPVAPSLSLLAATPKRAILFRLLNNLKSVYVDRDQPQQAGRVVEQMLIVQPNAQNVRDRGLLYLQEQAWTRGVVWLQRYLAEVPDAPDADKVVEAIERAFIRRASLN